MQGSKLRFATVIASVVLLLGACNVLKVFEQPDDKAITSEIQGKLFQDPVLKTRDIRVAAQKGVVVLTGTVRTDLEKSAAERMAGQASGVKQVISQLTVSETVAESAALAEAPVPPAATSPPEVAAAPSERPLTARRGEAPAPRLPSAPARAAAGESVPASPPAPTPSEAVSTPPSAPPAPQPEQITIPAGTVVSVHMIDGIDSSKNRPGEEFAASVDAPILVGERVVIPRGADARVRLVEARSAGRMTGRSELQVELVGLAAGSNTYAVETGVHEQVGASRGKRTAATVGGGAVLGALVGAIAGKGKGAAIGAAVGAGAGTAVQVATKGQQVQIPPETRLEFTLKVPVTVTR